MMTLIPYKEFLAYEGENQHVEWVNGRFVEKPPVSDTHQDIGGFLQAALGFYVEERGAGVIRTSPFQMKTGPELPGRAPDIFFASVANRARLRKMYLKGPTDLVIEIISPESRGRDRGDKFYEYEKGGVPEYWLIDPERKQAEFICWGPNGSTSRPSWIQEAFSTARRFPVRGSTPIGFGVNRY